MNVSFVIPTHNRTSMLMTSLRALSRECQGSVPFEVIVVDDGSTDSTARDVEALRRELSMPVELLQQSSCGPAVARNRGVEAAQSELIVFLGDDIIVQPGYVSALCEEYERLCGVSHGVLGHTSYSNDSIPTPFGRWLDAKSSLQFAYHLARVGDPLDFRLFYTSNVLVPRAALIEAGAFNPAFKYAAYEDTELSYRLSRNGFELYYCPAARALHVHPVSVPAFTARTRMTAHGMVDLARENPELFALLGLPDYPGARRSRPLGQVTRYLGHPAALRLLDCVDRRSSFPLPGIVYRVAMQAVFVGELRQFWPAPSTR